MWNIPFLPGYFVIHFLNILLTFGNKLLAALYISFETNISLVHKRTEPLVTDNMDDYLVCEIVNT